MFHDDDILHPQTLQMYSKILSIHGKSIKLIATRNQNFYEAKIPNIKTFNNFNFLILNQKSFSEYLYFHEHVGYANALYERESFLDNLLQFEKYGKFNDWPFMVNIIGKNHAALVIEPLLLTRLHSHNDSTDPKTMLTVAQNLNWSKFFDEKINYKTLKSYLILSVSHARYIYGKYTTFTRKDENNFKYPKITLFMLALRLRMIILFIPQSIQIKIINNHKNHLSRNFHFYSIGVE
jgi:hypothetical protein